jgi:hypothetical protein
MVGLRKPRGVDAKADLQTQRAITDLNVKAWQPD